MSGQKVVAVRVPGNQEHILNISGLLVFYEIFKFLEESLAAHSDSLIGDLLVPGMARTDALESDLAHYLGDGWKDGYVVRPEVQSYLAHLKKLDQENPYLLIPYIYHLYMGLFSGGQVLRATVGKTSDLLITLMELLHAEISFNVIHIWVWRG